MAATSDDCAYHRYGSHVHVEIIQDLWDYNEIPNTELDLSSLNDLTHTTKDS